MHDDPWHINLFSDVAIEDTSRMPFEQGQTREFALAVATPSALHTDEIPVIGCERIDDRRYWLRAQVVYRHDAVYVLDFGLLAYFEDRRFAGIDVGAYVSGEVALEVDLYQYMEAYHSLPGIPPLVYTWQIGRIAQDLLLCTRLPVDPQYTEHPHPLAAPPLPGVS